MPAQPLPDDNQTAAAPAAPPARRLRALDGLRCLAVALVIACHGVLFYPWPNGPNVPLSFTQADRWPWPLSFFWAFGPRGVDLFFVLSGFLVSGLIFREVQRSGRFDAGHFLIRRGLKIYPAFWVLIAATFAMRWGFGFFADYPPQCWVAELLFVQNYFPGVWGHTWSLGVEEHFYILLSVVLYLLIRRTRIEGHAKQAATVVGLVMLACLLLRLSAFLIHGGATTYRHVELPSHMRIDALALGVLLSYLYHYHHDATVQAVRRFRVPALVLLGAAVTAWSLLPRTSPIMGTLGLTGLSLAFGGLVMLAVTSEVKLWRPLEAVYGRLCQIGEYSYSIYLWHLPAMDLTRRVARHLFHTDTPPPTPCYIAYAIVSVVVGIVMAKLIEIPVLRVRDRWFPSRSGGLR